MKAATAVGGGVTPRRLCILYSLLQREALCSGLSVVFVCERDGEWALSVAVHSLVGPAGSSEQFHIHGHVHGLVKARES